MASSLDVQFGGVLIDDAESHAKAELLDAAHAIRDTYPPGMGGWVMTGHALATTAVFVAHHVDTQTMVLAPTPGELGDKIRGLAAQKRQPMEG